MKKRGATLIEVVISMALMAVLLIPASNIVISVSDTNEVAQVRRESSDIGQNVLENIKSITSVEKTDGSNLFINGEGIDKKLFATETLYTSSKYKTRATKKNGNEYDLEISRDLIDGVNHYSYNIPRSDYKKPYKVDIAVKKEMDYENRKSGNEYKKNPTFMPDVNTRTDEISVGTKGDYDLILKLTNDYNIILDEDDYVGNKEYEKAEGLILRIYRDFGDYVACEICRNKGTRTNIVADTNIIYKKRLFRYDELKGEFLDNANILFYLCNSDSKGNSNPYDINQYIIVQNSVDKDQSKVFGDTSNSLCVDVLSGENVVRDIDILFDTNKGYVGDVNYFKNPSCISRTGNLYSFRVTVTLDGEIQFIGSTKSIIED